VPSTGARTGGRASTAASVVEPSEDDAEEFRVSFDDEAAQRDDLVERGLQLIRRFPGVTSAWREDRDLIVGRGTPSPEGLEDRLWTAWERWVN
jgi:hypothetical protein